MSERRDLTPASFALYRTCVPARPIVASDASVANDATIEERAMKPPRFDYVAPKSLDEALTSLAQHGAGAKILAGGQSLIPLLNFRLSHPEVLIDINRIVDLAYVRVRDNDLAIGALTRQHTVERSEAVKTRVPILTEACRLIGHAPIRHRGTIGGNLAHADPASELPAVMLALEAQLDVASKQATRSIPADRFFTGPLITSLHLGEMVIGVRIPALPRRCRLGPAACSWKWRVALATTRSWVWPRSRRSMGPGAVSGRASLSAAWARRPFEPPPPSKR